jgi:hypothetical protein
MTSFVMVWAHSSNYINTARLVIDYDPVTGDRLKVDPQRLADGWYTYSFLELSQRYIQLCLLQF